MEIRGRLVWIGGRPCQLMFLSEYWSRGAHNAMIRKKLLAALEVYRAGFARVAEEALKGQPARRGAATAAGVAAVAVSLVLGYPVQLMIDAQHMDEARYLASIQGILGGPGSSPSPLP